jgi:hypothetical protein
MDFSSMIGLGVAGNFTGHLEQAGEAKDFVHVTAEEDAPKGIFPFYVPHASNFLHMYPLSFTVIAMPDGAKLQPEPEVALICELVYEEGKVTNLIPKSFTAYNDCSIRKEAQKISMKKNWGENSKGISSQLLSIDTFEQGGTMDSYRLTGFLKRDGKLYEYGQDSEIKTYSYFYQKLIAWLIDKINNQQDNGPLENIADYLKEANYPQYSAISIGATRYTEFGEKTYLQKADEVFVIVYDENIYKQSEILTVLESDNRKMQSISILHQYVS